MNLIARYLEYAESFEQTYEDDQWDRLVPYFTEAAIYSVSGGPPFGGRWEGRDAVIRRLRDSVTELDRHFEQREPHGIGGPSVEDDCVSMEFKGIYRSAGLPDLEIAGRERAFFDGDRISILEDVMRPGADEVAQSFIETHFSQ
jgi:hypothetical protein